MHSSHFMRRLALVSATALAAATLTTAPAHAVPVFTVSDLDAYSDVHDDSGSCTENPVLITPDVDNAPVTENGAPVTVATGANGSVTDGGADTQTGTSNITLTGSVSSTGTTLKGFDVTAQGSLSISNTVPSSVCEIHVYSEADLDYTFTVTQPGFLTVNQKNRGGIYTDVYLFGDIAPTSPYYESYAEGVDVDSNDVLYLPVGTYNGYVYAELGRSENTALSITGKSTVKATFAVVGSQSAPTTGKGGKYVDMAASGRSCAADTVTATVTSNKKRAKTIKQVTFFVNDQKVMKVKEPKKSASVVLTGIADGAAADVRAVVKGSRRTTASRVTRSRRPRATWPALRPPRRGKAQPLSRPPDGYRPPVNDYVEDGGFERDTDYVVRPDHPGQHDLAGRAGPLPAGRREACPWATRSIIVRQLLGLEDVISLGLCGPTHDERSWTLRPRPRRGRPGARASSACSEAFLARFPDYDKGITVPAIVDVADRPGRHQRLPVDHPRPVPRVARVPPAGRARPVAVRPPRRDGPGHGSRLHRGQQRCVPLRLRRVPGGVRRGVRAPLGRDGLARAAPRQRGAT